MATKPVLKSERTDVRALDEIFVATKWMSQTALVRVLRFFVSSQTITAEMLFPERFRQ
jgi:hypothetical protein